MASHDDEQELKFLDRNPPAFTENGASQIALRLFGLEGEFKPLKSERDQNFRIQSPGGERTVLKIANGEEEAGVIDFQTQALNHMAAQDPGLPVPRVVRTRSGDSFGTATSASGSAHIVHALSYLPGVTLAEVPGTRALRRELGQTAARLDLALRGFFHPFARQEHAWDLTRCAQLLPHTRHVTDAVARKNVERALGHLVTDILPRLRGLRHQVIHADIDVNNTLTVVDRPDSVAGIIDFGDMVFAPTVVEVAIAADAARADRDDLIPSICAVVAGYDSVLPLEEEEVDLIYDLILGRLAATATIIAWRRAMRPEQPAYNHEGEAPAWETMDRLLTLGRAEVRSRLRSACRFPPYCPVGSNEPGNGGKNLLERRRRVLGAGLGHFYNRPVHVERGRGAWLYNAQGQRLLDAYNNVPVAGHCHPHVVKAIARQTAALNTNTRYLYQGILDYAERLDSLMPAELSVCAFVNSGSEANDIAWRMAQTFTGRRGALVMEHAYHGITEAVTELTPSKLRRGLAHHVQTLMPPDPYRGPFRAGQDDLALRYAADADRALDDLSRTGFPPAAFLVDTVFTSDGIPDAPAGYLAAVAAKVVDAGGLLIADEVQAGFGRTGTHMWGFMGHGVVPDIVTLGKPIGNGYPLGAIVTRPEILDAFAQEAAVFSTFGGNPVACAAGMAVLDVIVDENLLQNAKATGAALRASIRNLMPRHELIGDVRGRGLMIGVELVRDRATLEPAAAEARQILDLMRERGVLIGREGPHGNVLKIRPPLVFGPEHAAMLVATLDSSLDALSQT